MSKDIKHFKARGDDDSWESLAKDLFGVEPAPAGDLGDLDVEPFRPVGAAEPIVPAEAPVESDGDEINPMTAASSVSSDEPEERLPETGEQDVRSLQRDEPIAAFHDPEVRSAGFGEDDFGAGLGIELPPNESPRTVPYSQSQGERPQRTERPRPPEPVRDRGERPSESRPPVEMPRAEPPASDADRDTYWDALDTVSSWDAGKGPAPRPGDEPSEPPRVDYGRRGGRDQGRGAERGGRPHRGDRDSGRGGRDRGSRSEGPRSVAPRSEPPRSERPPIEEPERLEEPPREPRRGEARGGSRRPGSRYAERPGDEAEPRRRDRGPRSHDSGGRDAGRPAPAGFGDEDAGGFGAGLADEGLGDATEATDVTPLESSVDPERDDPRRRRRRRRRPEGRSFEPAADEPLEDEPVRESEPEPPRGRGRDDAPDEVQESRARGRDRGGRGRYGDAASRRPQPARARESEFVENVEDEAVPPVAGWNSDTEDDDLEGEPAVSYHDLPTWEEAISYLLGPRPEGRSSEGGPERPRSPGPRRDGPRDEGPRGRGGRGRRRR